MHKRKAGLWAEGPMMGSCMPLNFIPVQTEGRPSLAEAEEHLSESVNETHTGAGAGDAHDDGVRP